MSRGRPQGYLVDGSVCQLPLAVITKRRKPAAFDMIPPMEPMRLKIPAGMQARMAYKKLAGLTPRMLVLESDYWLDVACIQAASELGWEIARVPVRMQGHMPREMIAALFEAVAGFKPDFVLSINLSGMDNDGMFARFFEDLALPYVTWFVDDPRTIIMDRRIYASPFAVAITWEAAYQAYLEAVGFPEVHVMPLAAETSLFNAEPADSWELPPAFIGNSMTDFSRDEWNWIAAYPELAEALRHAFEEGRVTRERFAEGLAAILDADLATHLDPDQKRHAEMWCFIEGTRRLRVELARTLELEGVVTRGDEAWREHVSLWGPYVGYRNELPAYYRACEVNLNSTSLQMATAVNQRVFDCPAAGGFLLTDAQASLETLFDPPSEIACYHSLDECRDLLRFYRAHPQARQQIAANARRRVLAHHTYHHRLREIAAIVKNRYGA